MDLKKRLKDKNVLGSVLLFLVAAVSYVFSAHYGYDSNDALFFCLFFCIVSVFLILHSVYEYNTQRKYRFLPIAMIISILERAVSIHYSYASFDEKIMTGLIYGFPFVLLLYGSVKKFKNPAILRGTLLVYIGFELSDLYIILLTRGLFEPYFFFYVPRVLLFIGLTLITSKGLQRQSKGLQRQNNTVSDSVIKRFKEEKSIKPTDNSNDALLRLNRQYSDGLISTDEYTVKLLENLNRLHLKPNESVAASEKSQYIPSPSEPIVSFAPLTLEQLENLQKKVFYTK